MYYFSKETKIKVSSQSRLSRGRLTKYVHVKNQIN